MAFLLCDTNAVQSTGLWEPSNVKKNVEPNDVVETSSASYQDAVLPLNEEGLNLESGAGGRIRTDEIT